MYEMLQRADSVGVFQVESRAQMATLPRLKPRTFYDLVVEVALIRPGPIQGGSVHPYIRRRNGLEPVTYDHPVMERSLAKTLGIPLFQEQLMQLAVDVAGFDAGEADQLRRAMGAKRSSAKMEKLQGPAVRRACAHQHGITGDAADRIYERLLAFANFGFAESHALSFAALVFYSSWLKLHHPAAFCAALLRAQPMGFYSPQSLVADARRHGVTIRRPDINASRAQADLEPGPDGKPAVRLGLAEIRTIGTELAEQIVAARPAGGLPHARRAHQDGHPDHRAGRGAGHRRRAGRADRRCEADAAAPDRRRRAVGGRRRGRSAGRHPARQRGRPGRAGAARDERHRADRRRHLGDRDLAGDLSDRVLPADRSTDWGVRTATDLHTVEHGTRVLVAGMVTHRQRPATASGVIFINLEDETGMINVICSIGLWATYRQDRPGVAVADDPRGGRAGGRGDLDRGRPDRRGESRCRHALAGFPLTPALARSVP